MGIFCINLCLVTISVMIKNLEFNNEVFDKIDLKKSKDKLDFRRYEYDEQIFI
ncbi:hypothetical protein [Clostridium aquiflavi]|uniref:hypothetical protein n=1 Tax=Clostridium aquiflavi TaxID=3073603 RepID=UPI0028684E51|nr:hypothetical protein [Clostridium sp. 5N-1]